MKIVLIADGRSVHAQRWAGYFAQRHDVHFISYDPLPCTIPGVRAYIVGPPLASLYLSFWPRHIAIRRIIRDVRPDIVHAHFITKYGFHLPFLGITPTIVSAWGDDVLILPKKSLLIRQFTGYVLRHEQ